MTRGDVVQAGAVAWAALGAAVALASLGSVNADAVVFVAASSAAGPLLALWAALELSRHAGRFAEALLVLSAVVTPTSFASIINLPALLAGLILVGAPHAVVPRREGRAVRQPLGAERRSIGGLGR